VHIGFEVNNPAVKMRGASLSPCFDDCSTKVKIYQPDIMLLSKSSTNKTSKKV